MFRIRRASLTLTAGLLGVTLLAAAPARAVITPPTPIQHVVILYQENHSFDETLGQLCIQDSRCDSVGSGKTHTGATIPLRLAPDVVPPVNHGGEAQRKAIANGAMNGFSKINGCNAEDGYACYIQYQPSQIPNLAALAREFVISDRTFQMSSVPSWGAHLELVAQTLNGFLGAHGEVGTLGKLGDGWGCDSGYDAPWKPTATAERRLVPACVPDPTLNPISHPYGGAYRPSPVDYVPTIMNRLDAADLSWKIYVDKRKGTIPYGWGICPVIAECLYTSQASNMVPADVVIADGEAGTLPHFSVVIPDSGQSQHNNYSMRKGDNWIGSVVQAIQSGPDWDSTAIFITYDDCGCFYDHVAPPKGMSLRVPMVIVSPYAKRSFTDSTPTTFSGMIAFTEHVFGLSPLTQRDADAYDYEKSFNFLRGETAELVSLTHTPVSEPSKREIRRNPAKVDDLRQPGDPFRATLAR